MPRRGVRVRDKLPKITAQEHDFCTAMIAGHEPYSAAIRAGFPGHYAFRLLRRADIVAALETAAKRLVQGELFPRSVAILRRVLAPGNPDGHPSSVLARTAVAVTQLGLHQAGLPSQDASLADMSLADLIALEADIRTTVEGFGNVLELTAQDRTPGGENEPSALEQLESVSHSSAFV